MNKILPMCAVVSLFCGSASADLLPILNPGFEEVALEDGGFTSSIPGWEQTGITGTLNPDAAMYFDGLAPEGENVAYSRGGWITQVLSSTVEVDSLYTLSIHLGNRFDADFSGYMVQLWAGDMMLAEDQNDLAPAEGTFEMTELSFAAVGGHAAIGEALEIRLWGSGATDDQINFDNVRLLAEAMPGAPVLGLFGLVGAFLGRRRR